MGNNCFKTTLLMRAGQLARARLQIFKLSRFRMFKVRPQDNVVLESCFGCFQIPIRMGCLAVSEDWHCGRAKELVNCPCSLMGRKVSDRHD